ncbi:SIR2 family protein [Siccirubricoccus sp. G192]|uniref:SIR2 family protein n=1 Tax=Siccirubricoccus sp. G192 TaxID=2849651 RepID=UPI001C2C8F21|nr:SIR2 family protein [Siccirubricoccus sp. G192]MBV1800491.1 SIR2 family protein [Siccirubricoccus sp. G192]
MGALKPLGASPKPVAPAPIEELVAELAQACVAAAPVVVLGSGASMPHGLPGMGALASHLVASGPALPDREHSDAWNTFVSKAASADLETVLTTVRLPEALTRHIVEATWDQIAAADLRVFEAVVRDHRHLALTRLFRHLLASTHTDLDLVTTNYDRLAEYAADAGELCHSTGFGHGHLRFRHKEHPLRFTQNKKPARTVNIWKVHGSLDWFQGPTDSAPVGLPLMPARLSGYSPLIITPGIEKFQKTHDEPFRTILANADRALQRARGYVCIGYGFNDRHIQPKLIERCAVEPVPLVLLTRTMTPAAREFVLGGQCRRYLVLEQSTAGTRAYCPDYPAGAELPTPDLWTLHGFLSLVM